MIIRRTVKTQVDLDRWELIEVARALRSWAGSSECQSSPRAKHRITTMAEAFREAAEAQPDDAEHTTIRYPEGG